MAEVGFSRGRVSPSKSFIPLAKVSNLGESPISTASFLSKQCHFRFRFRFSENFWAFYDALLLSLYFAIFSPTVSLPFISPAFSGALSWLHVTLLKEALYPIIVVAIFSTMARNFPANFFRRDQRGFLAKMSPSKLRSFSSFWPRHFAVPWRKSLRDHRLPSNNLRNKDKSSETFFPKLVSRKLRKERAKYVGGSYINEISLWGRIIRWSATWQQKAGQHKSSFGFKAGINFTTCVLYPETTRPFIPFTETGCKWNSFSVTWAKI